MSAAASIRRGLVAVAAGAAIVAATPSHAATVAMVAEVEGGDLPQEAVESILWHALWEVQGHDTLFLTPDADPVAAMGAAHLHNLYRVHLTWDPLVYDANGGVVAGLAPTLAVEELALRDGALAPVSRWTTYGSLALYASPADHDAAVISLPHVAVQGAARLTARQIAPAVWGSTEARMRLPVVLAADEEYRAFYGAQWNAVAARRVARANALLRAANIELVIAGWEAWHSDDDSRDLSALLDDLATEPHTLPHTIRVALTQQLAAAGDGGVEDVGRAFEPGRDVLIADQGLIPGQDPAWDEADEGIAVAHEVLHALGLPHVEAPYALMSATKVTTAYAMTERTRALAEAAAQARTRHWDLEAATRALSDVAGAWIAEPELQLDYIVHNLEMGLGVPGPGQVDPTRLSALTNAAIGRYYLHEARRGSGDAAALRAGAITHGVAALTQTPEPRHAALIEELLAEAGGVHVTAGPPVVETVSAAP